MIHEIKNQNGKHIENIYIRNEIKHALDNDMAYTHFNKTRIDIESDRKLESGRVTIVHIEGI